MRLKNTNLGLMVALLLSCLAFQLNISMLSPALITIAKELHSNEVAIGLTQTAFFIIAALFSIFLPSISDILGRKKVLSWILIIMIFGNILAMFSYNIIIFTIARMITGICGPMISLSLLILHFQITDKAKYGLLMGIITAVNGGIAGIDAFLGGYITYHFGFRFLFLLSALVCALALLATHLFIRESKPNQHKNVDKIAIILLSGGVFCLLIALNLLGSISTKNGYYTLGFFLCGIVFLWIFGQTQKSQKDPLIVVKYFKERRVWSLLITTILVMTGTFAIINSLILSYAQNQEIGFSLNSQSTSVLFLTPFALVGWLIGPFAGHFASKVGYVKVLKIGIIGTFLSLGFCVLWGLQSLTLLVIGCILLGITYAGITNIILNGLGVLLSPSGHPGFLSGMTAGAFNLGAGLSFVIIPPIQIAFGYVGYSNALWVGMIFIALAWVTACFIPKLGK